MKIKKFRYELRNEEEIIKKMGKRFLDTSVYKSLDSYFSKELNIEKYSEYIKITDVMDNETSLKFRIESRWYSTLRIKLMM